MNAEEEQVGRRLALWRKQQRPRVTQAQAAVALSVTQETVSRIENGHIQPSEGLADAIDLLINESAPRTEEEVVVAREFRRQIVLELRSLADFIANDALGGELHARKFTHYVTYYYEALPRFAQALRVASESE